MFIFSFFLESQREISEIELKFLDLQGKTIEAWEIILSLTSWPSPSLSSLNSEFAELSSRLEESSSISTWGFGVWTFEEFGGEIEAVWERTFCSPWI